MLKSCVALNDLKEETRGQAEIIPAAEEPVDGDVYHVCEEIHTFFIFDQAFKEEKQLMS